MNQLREIDYSWIRELRRCGQYYEANRLLETFREDLKKTKENELRNIALQRRLVKEAKGLCSNWSCFNNVKEGFKQCSECIEKGKVANKKYYKKLQEVAAGSKELSRW